MRLVIDASTVVAEALRERGQLLLADPSLHLSIAAQAWSEVTHELGKRIPRLEQQGRIKAGTSEELLAATLAFAADNVRSVPTDEYERLASRARARIPRDPDDWPSVALALKLDAGIWTNDQDFFGCGVVTWITYTLRTHLAAQPETTPAAGREGADYGHDTEDGGAGGHPGA